MKHRVIGFALAVFAACAVSASAAQPVPGDSILTVAGGTFGVRWNRDLAGDIGIRIGAVAQALPGLTRSHQQRFAIRQSGSLDLIVEHGHFRGFSAGALQVQGGFVLAGEGASIDLTDFSLQPRPGHPYQLALVSRDGKAWLYADHLMYDRAQQGDFVVRTMDLRISDELAARLRKPDVAGLTLGDGALTPETRSRGAAVQAPTGECNDQFGDGCNFSGLPAPDGGTYQADLFMESFSDQYSRCQGCTGNNGSGNIVFSPTSMLKNNVNAGSIAPTIPGDPHGTSTALWAADIPWYEMFSGHYPPYGNDQHPYLIWNLYRIDADGSLEQIARSGVKHAFLTVNAGADCPYTYGHVLGRTCEDTYTVSSNDDEERLGPRSEIVPATNEWGRCGSIFDPDCAGVEIDPDNGNYGNRMIVSEGQISPTANPGAQFMFESWYLAREDINIYNSMGTVHATPVYTGGVWNPRDANYTIGPAIDRWVDPATPSTTRANNELAVGEGHAKLAVKVTDNGDGTWRYDYAVMNFDFARAVTEGDTPDEFRVLSNHGFDRFRVALPTGAVVSGMHFSDGDLDASNEWTFSSAGGYATFAAPSSGNSLDWGSLYAFSITVDAAPGTGNGNLHVLQSGAPASFDIATLVPAGAGTDPTIFRNGFDPPAGR